VTKVVVRAMGSLNYSGLL